MDLIKTPKVTIFWYYQIRMAPFSAYYFAAFFKRITALRKYFLVSFLTSSLASTVVEGKIKNKKIILTLDILYFWTSVLITTWKT